MRKALLSALSSLFLLSCQALAQTVVQDPHTFDTRQASYLGAGQLNIRYANTFDISDAYVWGRAVDGYFKIGYESLPQNQRDLAESGVNPCSRNVVTNPTFGSADVFSSANIQFATNQGSALSVSTTGWGDFKSRDVPGNTMGKMKFSRQYKVQLPPGSNFGVVRVIFDSSFSSQAWLTGITGASVTCLESGRGVGIDFNEISNLYSVGGSSVGWINGVLQDQYYSFATQPDPNPNGNGLELGRVLTAYLLVNDGDTLAITCNIQTEPRNGGMATNGWYLGESFAYSGVTVDVNGYDRYGTQNLSTFPKRSNVQIP